MAKPPASTLDNVVSLCKSRGFVYPCGEIYGGTRSAWDYGPLGVELKENIKRQWWKAMVTASRGRRRPRLQRHPADEDVGGQRPPEDVQRPADRVPVLPQAVPRGPPAGGLRVQEGHRRPGHRRHQRVGAVPQLRHPQRLDRAAPVQHDAQDLPRRRRGRVRPPLPAARDRAGHLPQLRQRGDHQPQEAAVRHRPAGQELPQRDHARQLHLPHPRVRADGDGVLRQAGRGRGVAPVLDRRAHPLVRRPRHQPRQPAPLRAPGGEAQPLRQADRRHRVPLRLLRPRLRGARGHRQPDRLRPHPAQQVLRPGPVVLRPGGRRALRPVRHRAGGRPDPQPDGVPDRRLDRGRGARTPRVASTSAPCSVSTRGWRR